MRLFEFRYLCAILLAWLLGTRSESSSANYYLFVFQWHSDVQIRFRVPLCLGAEQTCSQSTSYLKLLTQSSEARLLHKYRPTTYKQNVKCASLVTFVDSHGVLLERLSWREICWFRQACLQRASWPLFWQVSVSDMTEFKKSNPFIKFCLTSTCQMNRWGWPLS